MKVVKKMFATQSSAAFAVTVMSIILLKLYKPSFFNGTVAFCITAIVTAFVFKSLTITLISSIIALSIVKAFGEEKFTILVATT
ncbi:MAG: hypothetical protein MR902_05345 [Campylobacter sp.]|nr:hypothetical protein [Campylobacter sp.]